MKSAVIVAAGSSSRFGKNKLEEDILNATVLERSVSVFYGIADEIIVVGECSLPNVKCVKGGETRFLSVQNGLAAVSKNCAVVAIHDGARPFVSKELVTKLFETAEKFGSAIPSTSVTDTVWGTDGKLSPVNRETLIAVQTPQCFNYKMLIEAFENAKDVSYTDESTLFWQTYGKINLCDGEQTNKKVTYAGDLPHFKVGVGFDVHAFTQGDSVTLGGVKIPFNKSLVGHSDADVVCHAICDAILSASGNKDIGHMFPDTDPKYLGADSIGLLKDCIKKAQDCGFEICNVSAVVICQEPKIAPYIDKMAERIANALGIAPSCVNLTATTTERLGALGQGDGIATQAEALLKLYVV